MYNIENKIDNVIEKVVEEELTGNLRRPDVLKCKGKIKKVMKKKFSMSINRMLNRIF